MMIVSEFKKLRYYMDIEGKRDKINLFYKTLSNEENITKMSIDELYKFLYDRLKIYVIKKDNKKVVEMRFFLLKSIDKSKYIFNIRKYYKDMKDIDYMKELKEELISYIIKKLKPEEFINNLNHLN